jgi:hypothetical protein
MTEVSIQTLDLNTARERERSWRVDTEEGRRRRGEDHMARSTSQVED